MIYTRGNPADYDGWRDDGCEGWGYSDLLPYFKRSEGNGRWQNEYHGALGPLKLMASRNFFDIDRRFLKACEEAGFPVQPRPGGARQIGAGHLDVTVKDGVRQSVARGYLAPAGGRQTSVSRMGHAH